jgi:micrococcal nuclease
LNREVSRLCLPDQDYGGHLKLLITTIGKNLVPHCVKNANAFTVPPNVKYEAEFRQAERAAREAERGLWAGSDVSLKIIDLNADAPGSDKENPNGEWVEIANQGNQPVQMQGYTLKDEANHIYTFGDFELGPGAQIRLYSGQGQDTADELYWGFSGESVWNNGGDAAFLRDEQGALVDVYAY